MSEAHASRPAGAGWDPTQYHRFTDHRLRPALELLHRVPIAGASVVYYLGCGSGTITRMIAERFAGARVIGLDDSSEMLAKASERPSRVEWVRADIAGWEPERAPELIYSNAALHWVDDHATLFPRLLGFLAPGGCLAVQMPLSYPMPSHVLMRKTLANGGNNGSRLGNEALAATVARKWVLDVGGYHDLLAPEAASLDVWETEYLQRLEGDDPVLEWVKATGLRPILNGLQGDDLERFIEVYRERLRRAYPRRAGGCTLYWFRRLFMVATRPALVYTLTASTHIVRAGLLPASVAPVPKVGHGYGTVTRHIPTCAETRRIWRRKPRGGRVAEARIAELEERLRRPR